MSATVLPFRPPAIPSVGYRVDVHQLGFCTLVILFQNRVIAGQRSFPDPDDANVYARQLAEDHRCVVIHHRSAVRST